jgi:LacI family transcriptional regulator
MLATERNAGIDAVSLRERLGGYIATRHLLELGHRRIGMIDGGKLHGNSEKTDGYQQALAEWGVAFEPDLLRLRNGYSPTLGHSAMDELMALSPPPTAVFGSIDAFAIGAMDWCLRSGLKIPDDISIAGFDDVEFAAFASTPLTTIAYDSQALAVRAVERLLYLIEANDSEIEPVTQLVDPQIRVRQSTAPVRGASSGKVGAFSLAASGARRAKGVKQNAFLKSQTK